MKDFEKQFKVDTLTTVGAPIFTCKDHMKGRQAC